MILLSRLADSLQKHRGNGGRSVKPTGHLHAEPVSLRWPMCVGAWNVMTLGGSSGALFVGRAHKAQSGYTRTLK